MKVKWLGHASVLMATESGIKIITDPYEPGEHAPPGGTLHYHDIDETVDIVVISHEHPDHNHLEGIKGNPAIVRGSVIRDSGPQTVKGITFSAIRSYHDGVNGSLLGDNNMVCFEVDGLKICHTGDIGHTLTDQQISELGDLDILLLSVGLLVPVGKPVFVKNKHGHEEPCWSEYIVDADMANRLYDQIKTRVILPIHYGNERCTFKLVDVEEYLKGKKNVIRAKGSEVEITPDNLPDKKQIIVLKPAL